MYDLCSTCVLITCCIVNLIYGCREINSKLKKCIFFTGSLATCRDMLRQSAVFETELATSRPLVYNKYDFLKWKSSPVCQPNALRVVVSV